MEWRHYKSAYDSPISDMFMGMKLTTYICPNDQTHIHRHSWDPFDHLLLQFPTTGVRNNSVTVNQLMSEEYKSDVLDEDHKIHCEPCGRGILGMDRNKSICQFPDYLALYIMRFHNTERRVDTHVRGFDSDRIDFTEFAPKELADSRKIPERYQGSEHRGRKGPFVYQCYGAVFHRGNTLHSGHYVAMRRNLDMPKEEAGQWYLFNDKTVTPRGNRGPEYGDEASNGSIVMLFLQRKWDAL